MVFEVLERRKKGTVCSSVHHGIWDRVKRAESCKALDFEYTGVQVKLYCSVKRLLCKAFLIKAICLCLR